MPYATIDQYEARYGTVADEAMLQECLDDCSAVIDAELDRRGVDYADPSESFADRLMRVCRSMANRVMPSDGADIPVGAKQASFTAGPYNQQFTFSTAYGTPKMLPSELALLGIGGGRIGCGKMA
jgi:hypothetical protein